MRLTWLFVLALAATALGWIDPARAIIAGPDGSDCVAGQMIIELRPELRGRVRLAVENGIARFGIPELDRLSVQWRVDEIISLYRTTDPDPAAMNLGCDLQYLVQFDPEFDLQVVLDSYRSSNLITDACPNAWLKSIDTPNDSFYPSQWHLPAIGAPFAWGVAQGDSRVLIGVLDDGCEWHHPDIEANLWINTPEDINNSRRFEPQPAPAGDIDGIDQDGNGYQDDVIGWDMQTGDPNPDPAQLSDDHGTHCWGIANAVTDNNRGVAGVPWNCRSFGFRCGGSGGINIGAAIGGIYYLVPKDGWVISMSFGGYTRYQPMADACAYAWSQGLVLVGGAGNDNRTDPFYPADYEHVISVAASGPDDRRTSWSNYGDWIEVTAPGAGILATVTNHRYGTKDGTSMATPLVAGALAWIKSAFPGVTNVQACSLLYEACDSMPDPLYTQGKLGAGRVSIANVILPQHYCNLRLSGWRFNDAGGNGNGRPDPGETAALVVTYANSSGWRDATGVTATLHTDAVGVTVVKGAAGFPDIPAGGSGSCSADSFVIRLDGNAPPQEAVFALTVSATPAPAYPDTTFGVISGEPRVLLVDDDLGRDYERWYEAACDTHGVLYDAWDVHARGASPPQDTLDRYPVVFWFTGDDAATTLTAEEQTRLGQYLDGGNNLMISGQNIATDLGAGGFLRDYLHAEPVTDSIGGLPVLVGVPGDPITEGDTMMAAGGGGASNARSMDGVRAVNGGIRSGFFREYGDTSVASVVRYAGSYKVVYFSVPFEALDHSVALYLQKWTLVERILEWFGERVPGVDDLPIPGPRPYVLSIEPNPFRRSARVSFVAPVSGRVELRTYGTDGRVVDSRELDVRLGERAGMEIDGSQLPAGIYLVQLVTPTGVYSQKTAVLK